MNDNIDLVNDEKILFDFSLEGRIFMRKPIVKKLSDIVKLGYVASRGDEPYQKYSVLVNCFEHASFNLTNAQIKTLGLDDLRFMLRSPFGEFDMSCIEKSREELLNFITQTGLLVEKAEPSKTLKNNQYNIAMYFAKNEITSDLIDFHFLLQEKDGTWSGKCGDISETVEKFSSPAPILPFTPVCKYKLDNLFTITNPYASKSKATSPLPNQLISKTFETSTKLFIK